MLFANFSKLCKEAILKHRLAITLKDRVNKLKLYCANYKLRWKTTLFSVHVIKYISTDSMNPFSVEMIGIIKVSCT